MATAGSTSTTLNIASRVERGARLHPERPALVFEGRTWSYADLDRQANRAAALFRTHGIAGGDRVALHLPNVPAFAWSYLGALKLGAIVVSLNTGLTQAELQTLLADCGASLLVTTASSRDTDALRAAIPSLRHIVNADSGALAGAPQEGDRRTATIEAAAVSADTPAAIVYTSGTTGVPRGAMLSHGNVRFVMEAKQRYLGVRPDDRLLLFLPLFHCFGQNAVFNAAIEAGATIVLHRRFDIDAVLRAIREDGVTMFFAVPTSYVVLLDAASPADLAGIRYFFSAAAPLPLEVETRWQRTFGRPIHQGYGLSETSPFASYNHLTAHRPGSVGVPIDAVEMRIVDVESGVPLPAGSTGEIEIRGPNVMLGYWNRPDETAAVMRDGWFRSGDIGRMDEDGYFYVLDRLRDMAIVGGFNIYPAEIENVLYQHPAVREAAVHGVPDPVLGERIRAVVVVRDAAAVTAEELQAFCRLRLAKLKVPAEVAFVDALPRNRSGKVLKRVLREQYVPPADVVTAPATAVTVDALERRITAWLAARLSLDPATLDRDAPFADHGLTSVHAVELAAEVSAWTGRDVPATAAWSFASIAALAAHVLAETPGETAAENDLGAMSEEEAEALLVRAIQRASEEGGR
jgi:long-chain acyl-CoA synthetase